MFKLMRLHQPVGIALLLWPCWWAIALASRGMPSIQLMLLFAIGAVIMRSAGCIINDLIDREVDAKVIRTMNRPLVTGEVTPREAKQLLAVLLSLGAIILFMMNTRVIILGLIALIPVVLYPFMKRITYWPQAFLGITFNFGALMGWASVGQQPILGAVLLYIGCICWTLGYDTIYAHQDKLSDAEIGIKSTALKFGDTTKSWLERFYKGAALMILLAAGITQTGTFFYSLWLLIAAHFYWQVRTVNLDDPADCMAKFRSNALLGAIVFTAIIAGKMG